MKWESTSSQPGPSVMGSIRPESSMAGMVTALITGPNSCGVLTRRARAYEREARESASTPVKAKPMRMPASGARSPISSAASTSRTAWKVNSRASRSTRPSSRAGRLTGVTFIRSSTPVDFSTMIAKPAKDAPNRLSWRSRPGTRICQEPAGEPSGRSRSSGPKKRR